MTGEEREFLFDQAVALSELLYRQTDLLLEMLEDIEGRDSIADRIDAIEDEGDFIFHEFSLRFSTITIEPSERRMSIFQMVRHIEEGIDMLDELSKCVVRHNVTEVTSGFRSSINCIAGAVKKEMHLINVLRTFDYKHKEEFIRAVNEFDAFKVEYFKMYNILVYQLFSEEHDPIDVMRWKSVYDAVKQVFEAFEVSADDCYKYMVFQNKSLVE